MKSTGLSPHLGNHHKSGHLRQEDAEYSFIWTLPLSFSAMSSQVQKHESKFHGFILESVTLYALRNFNINWSLMSTAPQITWIL